MSMLLKTFNHLAMQSKMLTTTSARSFALYRKRKLSYFNLNRKDFPYVIQLYPSLAKIFTRWSIRLQIKNTI